MVLKPYKLYKLIMNKLPTSTGERRISKPSTVTYLTVIWTSHGGRFGTKRREKPPFPEARSRRMGAGKWPPPGGRTVRI